MGLKKLFAARDMTQGAPWQRILEFSIPMLIGNVAQQLYNTADSVIVGMFEHTDDDGVCGVIQLLGNVADQHGDGKLQDPLPGCALGHVPCSEKLFEAHRKPLLYLFII